jgi:uncharacterized coiled-coil DUF342 family protein
MSDDRLGDILDNATQTKAELDAVFDQVVAFRKDYDRLMDAVYYFSLMQGTDKEEEAIERLKAAYQELQDTWGG